MEKVNSAAAETGSCPHCAEAAEEGIRSCSHCTHRTKERSDAELRDLMNRLKRIEGQVRGVQNMLQENAYCPDVLVQVSAITSALNSFSKVLLAEHIRTCVAGDIRAGRDEVIDELVTTLQKVMR